MPATWPLPTSEFMDLLPIAKVTSFPGRAVTTTEGADGSIIPHKRGARLWQGSITLDIEAHDFWAAIEADLSVLEDPGASFLFRDPRMTGPIADPGKILLGAADPYISALAVNNRELTLAGLPQGYVLQRGDLLGFSYGANPTRYAYHRIFTGGTASLGGEIADIEVTPKIRPGAAIGASVTLGTPVLKAVMKSANYGASRSKISEGGSFEWVQTLR
ncbi:hypothetical protein [Pseudophaeobacter sp.]|uniref:hypothetical protein n=1 Tax=Pseudophaeobacter sp. TaxID=1971739 RepID=UPI0032995AF2